MDRVSSARVSVKPVWANSACTQMVRYSKLCGRAEHGRLSHAESHNQQVLGQRAIGGRWGHDVVRHETLLL
jgi:hypothetical protein